MTPAIDYLDMQQAKYKLHRYQHNSDTLSYGEEAVAALAVEPARVFKTIVVEKHIVSTSKKLFAVAVVPVPSRLDLKAFATTLKCKKVVMAQAQDVTRNTGYHLGGVSPIAQKTQLPTVIDDSALLHETLFVSAGKRGLEIELLPSLLVDHCSALLAKVARYE